MPNVHAPFGSLVSPTSIFGISHAIGRHCSAGTLNLLSTQAYELLLEDTEVYPASHLTWQFFPLARLRHAECCSTNACPASFSAHALI